MPDAYRCNLCRRQFKSAAALAQHKKDSHSPSTKASGSSLRGRSSNGRRGASRGRPGAGYRGVSLDIAPSRIPPATGDAIVVQGEDRIDSFTAKSLGMVFKDYLVNPGVSPRLGVIAKAFQKIQWHSLVAYVTPQASAVTNGGYVAGFVMDPADGSVTAPHLASNKGAVTKKWYETAVVPMPRTSVEYFISQSQDIRLASPGRFWIISDGHPQNQINVVVTIKWVARLSHATVERDADLSFTVENGSIRPVKGQYYLTFMACDGKLNEDFSSIVPKLSDGTHYWRIPTCNVEYSEGAGDTGTVQMHFFAYKTSDKRGYLSQDGKSISQIQWQSNVDTQCLVPTGTYCRYSGTGNLCPTVLAPQASASSDTRELADRFNQLIGLLERAPLSSANS